MQCVHQLFLPRMKSPRNTSTAFTSHDSFARVSLHVVVDTRMMSDDWLFSPVNGGQRVDDQFGLRVFLVPAALQGLVSLAQAGHSTSEASNTKHSTRFGNPTC